MEVGAQEGHEFDIQAMFDRVNHPANGRQGGDIGGATTIGLDDGTVMRGKGKQFVPHGRRVIMAFPGGAGYGPVTERSRAEILRDLAGGYISPQAAAKAYGLDADTIDDTLKRAHNGEVF
jgi:N-methylhydantoinase B